MKTGRLVLLAVGVAFVAGGFLGGYFPKLAGFGLGPGPSGPTSEKAEGEKTPVTPDPAQNLADQGRVLRVQIDGEKYAILSGNDAPKPSTLYEVVSEAKEMKGDDDGVKVRVSRLNTSRYEAEKTLKDKLQERGIPDAAIDWLNGPAP